MKHGFLKVAAATPDIRVADVEFNTSKICEAISEACEQKAKIIVFPELCVTGYTCGDLFAQDVLLKAAKECTDQDSRVYGGQGYPCICRRASVSRREAVQRGGRHESGEGNRVYDQDIPP